MPGVLSPDLEERTLVSGGMLWGDVDHSGCGHCARATELLVYDDHVLADPVQLNDEVLLGNGGKKSVLGVESVCRGGEQREVVERLQREVEEAVLVLVSESRSGRRPTVRCRIERWSQIF